MTNSNQTGAERIVIVARERDLGGFSVRRLLPAIGCKMVGPFVFFDHMGPKNFAPGEGMDVRPHPHIGLATVTYLFDGAIGHRDSLGNDQVIVPGDINWMTAGRGIVHSERTPPDWRQKGGRVEGIQLWVALPRAAEETVPNFVHLGKSSLPEVNVGNVKIRILLGEAFGAKSPVPTASDTVYLDIQMPVGSKLKVPSEGRELAVYPARGTALVDGAPASERSMTVGHAGHDLVITATSESRVMVIGGRPFGEPREMWWNFVSSSKERIETAKIAWSAGEFGKVPGDEQEFIPLPEY